MTGTIQGGKRAAETNRKIHGEDFYARIGKKGGQKSTHGGFASLKPGRDGLTGPERAKLVGSVGGFKSRRGPCARDKYGRALRKDGKVSNSGRPRKTEVVMPEEATKRVHLLRRIVNALRKGKDA